MWSIINSRGINWDLVRNAEYKHYFKSTWSASKVSEIPTWFMVVLVNLWSWNTAIDQ